MSQPLIPTKVKFPFLRGFDTSVAQGERWADRLADVIATGMDFGIYKSGDGEHDGDAAWELSAVQSVKLGFPFLGYHVLEPYGAARVDTQVVNAINRIKGSGALGVVVDHELARGETGIVAMETCADFMDGIEQELGAPCVYYGGPAFLEQLEAMAKSTGVRLSAVMARLAQRPCWLADYRQSRLAEGGPEVPPPFADWTMWQLGPANSTLPWGVKVDFNLFRGTMEDFLSTCCTTGGL